MATKKLSKAMKKQWIEALLSDKFMQGQGELMREGRFCCLGVLCQVNGIESAHHGWIRNRNGQFKVLPKATQRGLADINDAGVPFEVIAGLIDVAL